MFYSTSVVLLGSEWEYFSDTEETKNGWKQNHGNDNRAI